LVENSVAKRLLTEKHEKNWREAEEIHKLKPTRNDDHQSTGKIVVGKFEINYFQQVFPLTTCIRSERLAIALSMHFSRSQKVSQQ
jgi:hypothetical protein